MGLAGNKKKSKISADPNNTAWAKSTTSFGHKILSKQGWKPGDFLGAENASHSAHYTAANASHIRVMLREDNLGIGAKIGTQNAETFGLSMFSGLLGRLNGKEEDLAVVKKKEETLRDVQLNLKYGNMNFVSGGLLVGDKMHEVHTDLGHLKDGRIEAVKKSKKRKAGSDGGEEDEKAAKKRRKAEKKANGTAAAIKEMKRKRKLEAGGEISTASDTPEQEAESSSSSSSSEDEKVEKRRKKAERKGEKVSKRSEAGGSKEEKARLKQEKRARKEERRKRKEEKRAKKAAKEAKGSTQPTSAIASEPEARSGTYTPTFMGGRQAVRHRYIMQKRMAAGSAQALKEIFMMKPQVAS